MAGEDRPRGESGAAEEDGSARWGDGLRRRAAGAGGGGASASDQAPAGAAREADGRAGGGCLQARWDSPEASVDCVGPTGSGTTDEGIIREVATCSSYSHGVCVLCYASYMLPFQNLDHVPTKHSVRVARFTHRHERDQIIVLGDDL
jgi:hypothetical protein